MGQNDDNGNSPQPGRERELIQLILENRRRLFGYVYSRLPNRSDTEDIVQETFITASEKFSEFERGTDFFAWVKRIAHWKIMHLQRSFARSRVVFDDELLDLFEKTSDSIQTELDQQYEALEICLGKLKSRDREMIQARYRQTGGVDAAALVSKRSKLAVYKALNRVRQQLFACIREQLLLRERRV